MSARALPLPQSLEPPELVGALAAGATSMVYLARDAGGLFALKHLQAAAAADPALRADFAREASLAAAVRHPNVVAVRGTGLYARHPYLALDFVEGASLQRLQVVEREGASVMTPVPTAVAARVVLDVLAALEAGHAGRAPGPVVHGDVSPGNVLVGVDGVSRLTDYGAACLAGAPPPAGAAHAPAGYAAPEAIRGEPLAPTADVFATGVVLWELFAGRRLFHAPTRAMIARQVLSGYIPDLAAAAPTVPRSVAAACTRALARDPGQRYPNAGEFRLHLDRATRAIYGQVRHEAVAAFLKARCRAVLDEVRRMVESTPPRRIASGVRPRLQGPSNR